MIELDRHIEILLLDNDCVIVPGLGGFMTHSLEARYDKEDCLFLPPTRTLGFNPQLKMNDPLLAQSYAETYDISYPEAVGRIEREVGELKRIIDRDGSYSMNDIGTLSTDGEGSYQFSPCESGILTPALYGLSSFEEKKLESVIDTTQINDVEETKQPSSATAFVKPMKAEHTEHDVDPQQTAEKAKTISIRVSVLRNIVAAAIALIAFLLIPSPVDYSATGALIKGNIDTSILYKIMPREETGRVSNAKPVKTTKPSASTGKKQTGKAHDKSHSTMATETMPKDYYCIVLASRVAKSNAEAFVQTLNIKGYDEAMVLTGHGSTKVIYGKYASEGSAYSDLKRLNDKEPFASAWIFHVKQ